MSRQVIPINNLNQVGIIKDTPSLAIQPNAFSDAKNVRLANNAVQKMTGEVDLVDGATLAAFNNNLGIGSIIHVAWWNNPNIGPNNGYFIVVASDNNLDTLYAINANTLEIENLDFTVPSGGKWQHTVFQGGYAFIINNGIAKPVYILDETGNTDITQLEAYTLPGWDSYYTKQEAVNDVYDANIHLPDFDVGRLVDFTLEEVIIDVVDQETGARKFSTRHESEGTVLQSTLSVDPSSNSHIVSIALAAGGVGDNAFTEFLKSGDQVLITVSSIGTVQVRCGVVRAWGDTLVAGAITELNAPLVSSVSQPDNEITFTNKHGLVVGDKISLSTPYKQQLTVSSVVDADTIEVTPSLQVADYSITRYTIVSAGKAVRNQPGVVRVSDVAAPGSIPNNWNPYSVGVSTAEEFQLSTTGVIQDMVQLQGNLYVYTDNSIHALSRTGSSTIPYVSSVVTDNYGALGTGCVIEYNGVHIVVGSDDIYQFSGHPASVKSLCVNRVKEYFYKTVDGSYADKTKVITNKANNEIWFCYATGENGSWYDEVLVWNYNSNTWVIRKQTPFTSVVIGPTKKYTTTLSLEVDPHIMRPIMSTTDEIYGCDIKGKYTDRDGDNYESYVERESIPLTPEFDVESLTSIALWVDTESDSGVNLRLRFRTTNNPGQSLTELLSTGTSGPTNVNFTIGSDYKSDIRLKGRLLHYRITDSGLVSEDWKLLGVQLEISKGGTR